ncbi:MAG TPA: ABC transporter ATP-binding protein [Bryobacteraceae bacterium]|nr:ABC transporter ATP-binding protein [Bryobacteraceae bacterium]
MSSEYAIEAERLTKIYRSRLSRREIRAVDDVSLQVRRGATYGLLGPNGAGKTTFVKMLLSAVHPTSGGARVFGEDASRPEARRPIGYLPENHRFPTYFTGFGMLDFYAALSGLDQATRGKRIPEVFARVGLEEKFGDMRVGKYSKGMLQRLGLAQALIHAPTLLILDEPADGVDPVGRREIRDILTGLEQQGVTIFINSHQLVEVELFCDEVAILCKGKLALSGKVKDLTAGKGYRLAAAQVPDALQQALCAQASLVAARDHGVEFQFPTRELANHAVDLLRSQKCEIESLIPTSSTLEEVFVKAVEQ